MNIHASPENLPALVDRAARSLLSARTSAEILEARDVANMAYDAAKSAARIARAKDAHDDVLAKVYRAQADAALIEAGAKVRLADEYDAAQERGEVGRSGQRNDLVTDGNEVAPTAADLGFSRKQIHEARQIRDAERVHPGIVSDTLDKAVSENREPTKADLRRSVMAAVEDAQKPERAPSRRNPDWKPNPENDAVLTFIDACETLAGVDADQMAAWNRRPGTRERMLESADAAHAVLARFKDRIAC